MIVHPYENATKPRIGYAPSYIKSPYLLPACEAERAQIVRAIVCITSIPLVLASIVSRYNNPIHENALKRLTSNVSPMHCISNIESNCPRHVRNNICILLSKIADITGYPQPSKLTFYPKKIIELVRSISEYDSWEENAEQWMVADIFYQILVLGWDGSLLTTQKLNASNCYKSYNWHAKQWINFQ